MFQDMFQLYLLTVLSTILAGLVLAGDFLSRRFMRFTEFFEFMDNAIYRIVLGIVSILIGLINLFPNFDGDIVILGNLLPTLTGLISGVILIASFITAQKDNNESTVASIADKVDHFSSPYLTVVGIASICAGILHAIFPRLPIL